MILVATAQPRVRVATAGSRVRDAFIKADLMSVVNTLSPQDAAVEVEGIMFDFGLALATGETITTVTGVTCTVRVGADPSPSSRLSGGSMVATSQRTGAASAAVTTKFGGALAGVTYRLQCVVVTSGGQTLSIVTYISGQAPP